MIVPYFRTLQQLYAHHHTQRHALSYLYNIRSSRKNENSGTIIPCPMSRARFLPQESTLQERIRSHGTGFCPTTIIRAVCPPHSCHPFPPPPPFPHIPPSFHRKSHPWDSNPRPHPYQGCALPTELGWRLLIHFVLRPHHPYLAYLLRYCDNGPTIAVFHPSRHPCSYLLLLVFG